jgi:AbrB family looped-hinge helix DNA binding protein
MTTVSLSSKFQIVIPKEVRETLELKPGIKVDLIPYADRIELIPVRPLKIMIGSLRVINTRIIL